MLVPRVCPSVEVLQHPNLHPGLRCKACVCKTAHFIMRVGSVDTIRIGMAGIGEVQPHPLVNLINILSEDEPF